MDTDYATRVRIGHNIRAKRQERDLTVEQLADLANVSRSSVYAYERGGTAITLEAAVRIAKVLRVDLNYLYTGKQVTSSTKAHSIWIAAPPWDGEERRLAGV